MEPTFLNGSLPVEEFMNSLNNYFSDSSLMLWSALFPFTYLLHIAEEYWGGGGYSAHVFKTRGIELSQTRFLALHSLGLALMVAGIVLATGFGFPRTMFAILGATVLVAGLIDALRSIVNTHYGPGLVTAIGLWLPLGCLSLVTFRHSMSGIRFIVAVAIGTTVSGLVGVIAMRGGKLI